LSQNFEKCSCEYVLKGLEMNACALLTETKVRQRKTTNQIKGLIVKA
jgi:hypothetical protein